MPDAARATVAGASAAPGATVLPGSVFPGLGGVTAAGHRQLGTANGQPLIVEHGADGFEQRHIGGAIIAAVAAAL